MYTLDDGYYIFEDHNLTASEEELQECKNDNINIDGIKKERNELLKKAHGYLGTKDFIKLVAIIQCCPYNFYQNSDNKYEKESCDYHHCCECWDKIIRENLIR